MLADHYREFDTPIMTQERPRPQDDINAQDEELLVRLAQANPALFAPLYERYFDQVYAYCLRRVGNTQEAEDVCSQVFARALSGLRTYRGGVFVAWLFGIARNTLIDHYHRRQKLLSLDDHDIPDERDDFQAVDQSHDSDTLRRLIGHLPAEQREIISLSVDAGLNSQEIGQVLGKSAGAVRIQLHRIFKQLRQQYEQLMGEQD